MALGMTYKEYWSATIEEKECYLEAHKLKTEQRNQEMWLQGFYVFKAIETAIHNQPAFALSRVTPISYLQEPIRITPYTEEEKREQDEKKKKAFADYLINFQKKWEEKNGTRSRDQEN